MGYAITPSHRPGNLLHVASSHIAASLRNVAALLMLIGMIAGCSTTSTLDSVQAPQAAPSKYAAIVVDANTGKVLFEENAEATRYPASLKIGRAHV